MASFFIGCHIVPKDKNMDANLQTIPSNILNHQIVSDDPKPLLVSIDTCRKLLGNIARSTVYTMINADKLKSVHIGCRNFIVLKSIEALLAKQGVSMNENEKRGGHHA